MEIKNSCKKEVFAEYILVKSTVTFLTPIEGNIPY